MQKARYILKMGMNILSAECRPLVDKKYNAKIFFFFLNHTNIQIRIELLWPNNLTPPE
jgi:hypothetical protein